MSMMTSNNYNTNPGYEDDDDVIDNYPGYNDDDDDIEDPKFNRRRGPFDRSAREETNFDDMFLSDEDENGFMEEEEEEEDLEVVQHREYMEKMRKKIVDVAIGDFLVYNWNNPSDIKVVKPTWRAPRGEQWKVFAKCVIKAYQVDSDPKARFVPIGLGKDGKYRIYTIPNVSIEHKGNNDLYKTFEYNSENIGGRTVFTPASSYYTDDIKFGKEYTKTLANIGNEAAVQCINYDRNGVLAELKGEWYLPTFEELCKAMNNRAIVDNKGIYYWSSSVPGRDEEDEDTSRQNYNYAVSSDDIFILSNYSSSHGTETIRPTMNAYVLPFLKF